MSRNDNCHSIDSIGNGEVDSSILSGSTIHSHICVIRPLGETGSPEQRCAAARWRDRCS